jgi:hypothetical protein
VLSQVPDWPCHDAGMPLVDLTKGIALADELDDQAQLDRMQRIA